MMMEGVIAADMNFYDLRMLWKKIVKAAFGAAFETMQ